MNPFPSKMFWKHENAVQKSNQTTLQRIASGWKKKILPEFARVAHKTTCWSRATSSAKFIIRADGSRVGRLKGEAENYNIQTLAVNYTGKTYLMATF
jgi:hypothetical protein